MNGKHIELFLVDGVAGGITTVEIAGWTGHLLAGPRAELTRILESEETKKRNGAYILLGHDLGVTEQTRAYIGRTENFVTRLQDHNAKKSFWNRLVIITAKDAAFNEGHWGDLEARLFRRAYEVERCHLENSNTPQGRKLSEAQTSDMIAFFAQLQVILPVLGVNILRGRKTAQANHEETKSATESPIFSLKLKNRQVDAKLQVVDDEFFILAGSRIALNRVERPVSESTEKNYASIKNKQDALVNDGSVRIDAATGYAVTTRDIPCSSTSQAGDIVTGRSSNGRKEWKLESGGTYADWEERGLNT